MKWKIKKMYLKVNKKGLSFFLSNLSNVVYYYYYYDYYYDKIKSLKKIINNIKKLKSTTQLFKIANY